MNINFGDYTIKLHELDEKLSVQITSTLGDVKIMNIGEHFNDFPCSIKYKINTTKKIEAKELKKFSFGAYKFILGVNFDGEFVIFHSKKLNVSIKLINNQDTLSMSLLGEPK